MQKLFILMITTILLVFFNNCTQNRQNSVETDLQTAENSNKTVNDSAENETVDEKINLQEMVLENGTIKAKFPCPYWTKNREVEYEKKIVETENIYKCVAGNLAFSITIKKSQTNLAEEFSKIKAKKNGYEKKIKGLRAIEYFKIVSKTTTSADENNENIVTDKNYTVINNRLILSGNHQLTNIEITCNSPREKYCENLLIENQSPEIKDFYDSVETLKFSF